MITRAEPAPPQPQRRPKATQAVEGRRRGLPPPPRWVSLVGILAIWQFAAASGVLPPDKLAAPSVIAGTAARLIASGELAEAIGVSLSRVGLGLALGLSAGVLAGIIAGLSRWGDALLDPPLQALRTLPHLGLVPLFILWFGIGETPKVLLIALGVAFPIYLNLYSAIRSADRGLLEAAQVNGLTRRQKLAHVILPSATPQALVGLRQGLAIAWLSLIVGEQINAEAGLGYLINNAREFLLTDVVVVGLLVYALLGLGTDWIVRIIEGRALRWREGTTLR
ncbi:aliphatic sulfonate ABC transporter permease protein [Kineosphaera limosa NBRC 100340]|uniref:Aliphatic sulfonate ABC transporter permease protein n=1 Tax=Kineosphaera limosa NBRC 100340 TaxID=1184609 RepID=K6WXL6_9MICO|nr:aliphatic sulfonate ABC transporter permease protein [Kineosphaera limosa NBRC 100340]